MPSAKNNSNNRMRKRKTKTLIHVTPEVRQPTDVYKLSFFYSYFKNSLILYKSYNFSLGTLIILLLCYKTQLNRK